MAMVVASGLDIPLGICGDRARAAGSWPLAPRVVGDGRWVLASTTGRHLDVVVLRGEAPIGNGSLLPVGTKRACFKFEPCSIALVSQ